VLDRFLQQAVMQVLQEDWDPTFSPSSYAFRPGRSAHQAVAAAQQFIANGCHTVVDLDLEKFFDRVNHDILMGLVAKRVQDRSLLRLIRRYLTAGVLVGGMVDPMDEGVPQGGPLSPLLSNLMLDVLDKELERRGHRFARYAGQTAGERVVADVAERLFNRFIKPAESTGMCYRLTFFLHLYLADKGVQTVPVVGYINDGSDDIMISHAWLEFGGKKTDLTLGITEDPDLNPVGNVIILDQILFSGLTYTYQAQ
jgi:hypothetical protein